MATGCQLGLMIGRVSDTGEYNTAEAEAGGIYGFIDDGQLPQMAVCLME